MSTTTLRVILDQAIAPVPGGIGRYAVELTRELIACAPRGCDVAGIVPASPPAEYDRLLEALPGLTTLHKSALDRRQLAAAWQHGFTRLPGTGMVHAPSLFAPLLRHDRVNNPGDQIVVTIHDTVPWSHPETLTPRGAAWHRAMAKRAERYADAIVVPTHAVAEQLAAILDLGERVRVIGGAPSSDLVPGPDASARAAALDLPDRYLVWVGTIEPRKGIAELITALSLPAAPDLPLVIVGRPGWGGIDVEALAREAGLDEGRVRLLGGLDDADLAAVLERATVAVVPSLAEGFGLPLLEAMSLGVPVVHSDDAALVEVADGAGLAVALAPLDGYPQRLAEALRGVVDDPALAAELAVRGRDRARAYSWRDSAEKTWQLHADL
ncbi:MAG: glycosyltransferase family 4 protein [Microcella sp.]